MADHAPRRPGTSSHVTDRRPVPRGVLPRGVQTWLMAGLAVGMLAIMLLVGPAGRRRRGRPTHGHVAAGAERRPRARLPGPAARAGRAGAAANRQAVAADASVHRRFARASRTAPPADPLEAERQRREYESLFASNVVLSRRPEGERPDAGRDRRRPRRRHD